MPTLKSLSINDLRNLTSVSVSLSPAINIFYGANGSGKTSLLEAVSLLGMGRSFRSHKGRSLICHDKSQLTVFSEVQPDDDIALVPVGLQKTRSGETNIKVDRQNIQSAAVLAQQLPLIIMNAHSFQLIEGSPIQRRQFLDWMVFHVKPEFGALWKGAQKLLKQRNSLLRRDKITPLDLAPWDKELSSVTEQINSLRISVFEQFVTELAVVSEQLFSEKSVDVELDYHCGWDSELTIEEALSQSFERDRRNGYTHIGPQRADIKIRFQQKAAADVLSRGQEKIVISAMMLAQSVLYRKQTGRRCVFLLDDLLAELDGIYSRALAEKLTAMGNQVLITGIEKQLLLSLWDNDADIAVFHVEHGDIQKDSVASEAVT